MATATKERKKSKRENFQASTPDLERDYAELLWGQLAEGLESADQAVRLIVRNRAWEPLGYGSFTEAWNDRLKHITLATDGLKAQVLYVLYDEGVSEGEAATLVKGVGPKEAKAVKRQKASNVPVEQVRVREFVRSRPDFSERAISVKVDAETYAQYRDKAKAWDSDLETEVRAALEYWFTKRRRR